MQYLDSNILIYAAIEQDSERGRAAKKLLLEVAEGRVAAATSSLTWDEIVWVIKKFSDIENAAFEGRRFLEIPNLRVLGVDGSVLYSAQILVERYKIAPRDAIHAATAMNNGIVEFVSYDTDYDQIKGIKRTTPKA